MRRWIFLGSLLALTLHSGESRCEGKTSGAEVFTQLGSLLGTWTGPSRNGGAHTVTYRYTAAGSVLVETWTLGSGRESMTLYALDDDRLLATHYCPQGNQPRLEYTGADRNGRWQFRFRDGSNLHAKGHSHQQAFWIKLHDDKTFERGETYVDNDEASAEPVQDGEAVSYTRVAK
jgi:YD repeat-containing protein